jgi:hypothetical protein
MISDCYWEGAGVKVRLRGVFILCVGICKLSSTCLLFPGRCECRCNRSTDDLVA